MAKTQKSSARVLDAKARKLIFERVAANGWRKTADELDISRGYLHNIAHGKRPASNKVLAGLGLPARHIEVKPLACGHAPLRNRCPICKSAPKYAPHPVMRLTEIERRMTRILGLLNGETPSSTYIRFRSNQ